MYNMAGYIEPGVSADLAKVVANPNIMAGNPMGGPGIGFKARNFLRQAGLINSQAVHNIETYHPTVLATVVEPKAVILATTTTSN